MIAVAAAITGCALFGALFYYSTLLAPLAGEELFAWRILISVPLMALCLRLLGALPQLQAVWRQLRHRPALALLLLASAALLGVQLWLFTWAPLHGYALDVSLGYFLLPLVMVAVGRWVFNERLSSLQTLATGVASLGVAHAFLSAESAAWPTFLVALGYPVYFVLRRKLATNHLGGLFVDMLLMVPAALLVVGQHPATLTHLGGHPVLGVKLLGFGVLGVTALVLFLWASRHMRIGLFGLLSYFEPVFLVLVALLVGERLGASDLFTYGPIWVAMLLLVADGIRSLRTSRA